MHYLLRILTNENVELRTADTNDVTSRIAHSLSKNEQARWRLPALARDEILLLGT